MCFLLGIAFYLNATVNPFLYSLLSKRFRRGFQDLRNGMVACVSDGGPNKSSGPEHLELGGEVISNGNAASKAAERHLLSTGRAVTNPSVSKYQSEDSTTQPNCIRPRRYRYKSSHHPKMLPGGLHQTQKGDNYQSEPNRPSNPARA